MLFLFAFLRRQGTPTVFAAILAFRWFQVALLLALAGLYAAGILPIR